MARDLEFDIPDFFPDFFWLIGNDEAGLFEERNNLRGRCGYRAVTSRNPQFGRVRIFKVSVGAPRSLSASSNRCVEKYFNKISNRTSKSFAFTLSRRANRYHYEHTERNQSRAKPLERIVVSAGGSEVALSDDIVDENASPTPPVEIIGHRLAHGAFARTGTAGKPKTSTGSHGSTLRRLGRTGSSETGAQRQGLRDGGPETGRKDGILKW